MAPVAMSFRPLRSLLPAILALLPSPAWAGDDVQLWAATAGTVALGRDFVLSQELFARFGDRAGGLYEVESNTLLGYRLSRAVTMWGGYTHDPLYNAGQFRVMEHRAREQLTADDILALGPVSFSVRLRLEQRWREGLTGTGWRFRPFVRAVLPIAAEQRAAIVFSHESFINLNDTGFQQQTGEERMRNLLALRTRFSQHANIEIGNLHQRAFAAGGADTSDHVATVTLGWAF